MNTFKFPLFTASLVFAIALTISCSSDDDGGGDNNAPSSPSVNVGVSSSSSWSSSSVNANTSSSSKEENYNSSSSQSIISSSSGIQISSSSTNVSSSSSGGNSSSGQTIPPTITTKSLPSAKVGTPYNQTLTATGDSPITWSLYESYKELPTGLTLSTDGVISGTPTVPGYSYFVVMATNAGGSNTIGLSLFSVSVVEPTDNIMYHGFIWTPNPTSEELSAVISGEWATDGAGLNPSEVTREGKTITFRGSGVLCIMIPKAIGQIASLKNSLGSEILNGNPPTFFARGEITFNGTNYYLYTGENSVIAGIGLNVVMSIQ